MSTAAEKSLREELDNLQKLQQESAKYVRTREQLQTQLSENTHVKEELDLVKEGDVVYKLMGPALVKQDLPEARTNVAKRLEYIEAEIKRYETLIKENEEAAAKTQENALKIKAKIDAEAKGQEKK
eukprot:m.32006 g.32006  ORF g.32006 m.32006 type:complete len:126 (-) comp10744_c0_seq1:449-826(-)